MKKESPDYPIFIGKGFYLALTSSSIIKEIENSSVPELQFNFAKIDEVKLLSNGSKCGKFINLI